MTKTQEIHYDKVAEAIAFLKTHYREQPSLEAIADEVCMSPQYFQRIFKEWAGISPKKFLQYISIENAKKILGKSQNSLFDAAYETGLSGTGRLHDLFVSIEGMTPGEYKNGGQNLHINYSVAESPFGKIMVASTNKGICHMGFMDNNEAAFEELKAKFPNAKYQQVVDLAQQNALFIFTQEWDKLQKIKLHLKGTKFQLKVWETLLKIPKGNLVTYGNIAAKINSPKASRAVGTAIGSNPVAYLIPCHRVIRGNGETGGYMWGQTRKSAIIGWEAAKTVGRNAAR